jgi:membrane carboxypeptidase/penicillin-binding protein PbpC
VLGVWIGNFDGTPHANLIGREAGPLFSISSMRCALAAAGAKL